MQPYLTEPHTFEIKTVQSANQLLALFVYGRKNHQALDIPIIRLVPNTLSATLARYLVLSIILDSSHEKRVLTKITDFNLSNEVMDALQENGFVFTEPHWIKANLPVVETEIELASRLLSLSNELPQANQYFQKIANSLESAPDNHTHLLLDVERSLWPAKITNIDIPAFIVPIWADWAMQLFDFNLASQDIFGGKLSLILGVENVYYRAVSPHPKKTVCTSPYLMVC
ncbi:GCN5-related N-acetyltransferase [Beggiatoa sp. PS]|nr:GCN5-related N-acetyltransferase [Beggiatoa sp. PS]